MSLCVPLCVYTLDMKTRVDQCEKGREDVLDKKQEAQYVIHITDQSEEILGDGWKPQKRG